MTKYKLTDETKEILGRTLHRIVCVTAFANVAAGKCYEAAVRYVEALEKIQAEVK